MTEAARPRKKRRKTAPSGGDARPDEATPKRDDTPSGGDAPEPSVRRKERRAPPRETPRPSGPRLGPIAALGSAAAYLASVFVHVPGSRDVLLACAGGLAFLAGAAGLGNPRTATVVFGFVAAVGLALVGIGPGTSGHTLTLDVGVGLAMAGVLGLGGSIHRLGRLGPA